MAKSNRIIPTSINTDLAADYFNEFTARVIKNLSSYVGSTDIYDGIKEGENVAKLKPLQSNELYTPITLPEGINLYNGAKGFPLSNVVIVFVWNSNDNHCIYKINGDTQTAEIVKVDSCFNFQNDPKYFIHESGCWLEVIELIDPKTGNRIKRSLLFWTNGFNTQGFLCLEDSIATNGYDETQFPYFTGTYDKCLLVRMGLPHYMKCFDILEMPNVGNQLQLNNALLFHGVQVRITYIDVWGRPSEHSIISDLYIPATSCLSTSNNLPRCLGISFDAGNPTIDKIQFEYSFDNSEQWYVDSTIEKYNGSNIGNWWERTHRGTNPSVDDGFIYNSTNNKITYIFCADKEQNPIDVAETNRTQNPLGITSQALVKLNETIATCNNTNGFTPIEQEVLNKIKFEVLPPTESPLALRNITVYVAVVNPFTKFQSGIRNANSINQPNLTNAKFCFGGYNHIGVNVLQQLIDYKQLFANSAQRGFIGYLAGSNNAVISEQGYFNASGVFVLLTDADYINFDKNKKYFQRFTFNSIAPAKYVFRIASHLTEITNVNYQATSTYSIGRYAINGNQITSLLNPIDYTKEVIIDLCSGDYNSFINDNKILGIYDLMTDTIGGGTEVSFGYLYESQNASEFQRPIELCEYDGDSDGGVYLGGKTTDHNGFYFGSKYRNGNGNTANFFYDYYNCQKRLIARDPTFGDKKAYDRNVIVTTNEIGLKDYYTMLCNRYLIKGKVLQCGTNIGVPNIGIVYSRGQVSRTDANGEFTIAAHYDSKSFARNDFIYFIPSSCPITDCSGGCVMQITNLLIAPCEGTNICVQREYTIDNVFIDFIVQRGLLNGGRYGFGIAKNDWLRRHGYVNAKDSYYLNIPSNTETKLFSPSRVKLTIDPNANFSNEVELLSIYYTAEQQNIDYIEWIVDKVEFINNAGVIDKVAPTQIKIYYASLNEYNKQNNFNTTTGWQIIPSSTTSARTSDTVEFIFNGDGTFFNKRIKSLIKYDKTGQYFLIDYTTDLKDLKQFALMRLAEPRTNTGIQIYYELCQTIPVVDGKATINELILNCFDTYYLFRQIPIPITTTTGTPPVTTTVNELRTFGFPFEHHSPSDLWGSHIKNIGRVNAKNPYEDEIVNINEIAISGGLSKNGQLNYLCYFDNKLKTNFEVNNTGGIYHAIVSLGMIRFLTQYDAFVVGFNDNLARITAQGTIQVASASNTFGKPEKMGNGYGCQAIDKNTVKYRNGLIMFVDRNSGDLFQVNGTQITSMTDDDNLVIPGVKKGKMDAQFRAKIKFMLSSENKYFIAAINPITNEYLLTNFDLAKRSYINAQRGFVTKVNETFSFDIDTKEFKATYSFTPEGYAYLDGDILNNNLFSFKDALPYSHYNVNTNNSFNTFYGVKCEEVVEIICATPQFRKKMFLNLSVWCKQKKYFADKIRTESGQQSVLYLGNFRESQYYSFAPFFRDTTTPQDPNLKYDNNLIEGRPLFGNWISIRLIGDPAMNDKYSELLGFVVDYFDSEGDNR